MSAMSVTFLSSRFFGRSPGWIGRLVSHGTNTRSETMEKIASQGISVLIKPFSTKHILELIERPPASVSHDLN